MLRSDFIHTQIRWTASFSSPFVLYPEARVRYDLVSRSCTIRSGVSFVYDTILRLGWIRCDLATRFGTISISEPHILRYLVVGELRSLST